MSYTAAMGKKVHWSALVLPEPNSGCLLWNGRYSASGYGTYGGGRNGERVMAHRLVWEETNGPIPAGMFVCHRCDVRGCVNLAHLFLGTAKDNTRDMMVKGRARFVGGAFNASKTHCKYGHPFVDDNIYWTKKGGRTCLECAKLKSREYRESGGRSTPSDMLECRQGHPFTEANTRVDKWGIKNCRECDRTNARLRRTREATAG